MAVQTERIRALNDAFRSSFQGGKVTMTKGVQALPSSSVMAAIEALQSFDQFTEEDDPHGEHDFGSFALDGHEFFWKIDYYDKEIKFGSDDPADATTTSRVLTLMLAEEY